MYFIIHLCIDKQTLHIPSTGINELCRICAQSFLVCQESKAIALQHAFRNSNLVHSFFLNFKYDTHK